MVSLLASTGVAAADPSSDVPVVSATIYPSKGGSVENQTVTLGYLQTSCQTFGGEPGNDYSTYGTNGAPDGSFDVPSGFEYSIHTVIQCGLSQPINDVDSVEIDSPSFGWELSPNSVLDTSDLEDPPSTDQFATAGAEPELFADTSGLIAYFRPWRGGTDDNVHDEISANAKAIGIVVYEDGTPLNVFPTGQIKGGTTVTFAATVTAPGGAAIPSSDLTWKWDFGDGYGSSALATPTYTYASTGDYPATVQVYDSSTGQAGTGNDPVDFPTPTTPGTTPQTGSGTTTPTNGAPTGPTTTAGKNPNTPPGSTKRTASPSTHHHTKPTNGAHTHKGKATHDTKTTPASTATGTGGAGASSTGSSKAANDKTLASKHSTGYTTTHAKSTPHRRNGTTLVNGRLISDVTTLPADQSPLVHAVSAPVGSAPVVRRATSGPTNLPVILAGVLTVLLLFGFGVGRELRWLRGRPPLPSGA